MDAPTPYQKWYSAHREERLVYLKEYAKKRKEMIDNLTEEEKKTLQKEKNERQRVNYRARLSSRIKKELEDLKTTADDRYTSLIDGLIKDKKYETLTLEGLKEFKKLVRFIV
jgi:hypothetical protein